MGLHDVLQIMGRGSGSVRAASAHAVLAIGFGLPPYMRVVLSITNQPIPLFSAPYDKLDMPPCCPRLSVCSGML